MITILSSPKIAEFTVIVGEANFGSLRHLPTVCRLVHHHRQGLDLQPLWLVEDAIYLDRLSDVCQMEGPLGSSGQSDLNRQESQAAGKRSV